MSSTKKTENIDVFDKIKQFQCQILMKKPDVSDMIHEVRMMNYKVRPLTGDVSELDFGNMDFIDALWSLGKLDEFFRAEFTRLQSEEQEAFFRLMDDMRSNLQQQLNKANIASIDFTDATAKRLYEVEIIKDSNWQIN